MNLYSRILKVNQNHKHRQAVSITMASGEVRKYTYETLFHEANVYAKKMTDAGIQKGDRIIIVAENSPQWQMAFLAIMQIQATAVLIDASLSEELLKESIEQADARGIFTSRLVKEKLGSGADYRVPMFNLSKNGEVFKDSFSVISPFVERTKDPMTEIAMIFFDGHTKQDIKGVMYTHEAMLGQVHSIIREQSLSRNEHILSVIPNSQIDGMVTCVLTTLLTGAALHYVESLDYESLSRAFKGFKPTIFPAFPGMLMQLKQQIESTLEQQPHYRAQLEKCEKVRDMTGVKIANMLLKQAVLSFGGRLEMIWSSGPIEEEIMRFYYSLGLDVLLYYGRLETNTPILGNRGEEISRDTCGQPYPDMEIELRAPNEKGQGEMYVKSPYGMAGYFRNKEAHQATFEEGWFKTGDLAELVSNSQVRILYKACIQDENPLKELGGLSNKTNSAYYWFNTWRNTAKCLYKLTIMNETYVPEHRGCIIYSPFETNRGYLGLILGYSKERFFKFGYLTNIKLEEKLKVEGEAFGKIYYVGDEIDEEAKRITLTQLDKGWAIIVKAPKDAINAKLTEQMIDLAKVANVPIVPAYLEGEEAIFSSQENLPKVFDLQSKKRYSLELRYGKPIEISEESGMIKRRIQESFTALIENQPQEEEEPIDEMTQMALEMLSIGHCPKENQERSSVIESKEIKESHDSLLKMVSRKDEDLTETLQENKEDFTERIDLKELLALEENIDEDNEG